MADEVEMTPVGADELPPRAAPFTAAPTPAAPAAPAAPADPAAPAAGPTVSTIRLKPVIRKPVIRKPPVPGAAAPAAPAAPAATEAAKRQTSSLKSVTGPIPAQATLRKTGIIAEGILTPAQQQAAKSKTSRISLESAIGVAPTSPKGPAPLKTIRLRRPTDLNKPPAPSPFGAPKPASTASAQPAGVDTEATTVVSPPLTPVDGGEQDSSAVTQKKTLKLTRPGGAMKRPTLGASTGGASDGVADLSGDIPELKPLDAADFGAAVPVETSDVPGWLLAITTITSLAALLVLGAVFYFLFTEGCAPVSGENYTAFMSL